jgi:hypothetical protein
MHGDNAEQAERSELEEAKEQDRNGTLHAVSLGQNARGVFLSLFYGTGKVTHFLPNKIAARLANELRVIRVPGAYRMDA